MEQVNEFILKISSSGVSLPESLELGKRYLLSTEVYITETNKRDNNDETVNMIYKARQTGNIEILTEGKTIIKAEAKKSVSQSLHGSMWYYWNDNYSGQISFDEFYQKYGKMMSAFIPDIMQLLISKNKINE